MRKTSTATTSGSGKKRSTVKTGNLYKSKTKKWFVERGYETEYAEIAQAMFIPGKFGGPGRMFYRKRDLFGADGISMNNEEIIFWNSKASISKVSNQHIKEGIEEFNRHPFPACVKRQLIVWAPRQKDPEVIDVDQYNREHSEEETAES